MSSLKETQLKAMNQVAVEVDDTEPDIPEASEYESINLPIATSNAKVGDGLTQKPALTNISMATKLPSSNGPQPP